MIVFRILSFSALLSPFVFASSEPFVRSTDCVDRLGSVVLRHYVMGYPDIEVFGYSEAEMLRGFRHGYGDHAETLVRLIQRYLKSESGEKSKGDLLEFLEYAEKNPAHELANTMLVGNFSFRREGAIAVNVYLRDPVFKYAEFDPNDEPPSAVNLPPIALTSGGNYTLLKPIAGPENDFSIAAAFFLHEWMHASDERLLQDWLNANLARIDGGKSPDFLFSRYTRWDGHNLHVNQSFLKLFFEARGVNIQQQVIGFYHPNHETLPRTPQLAMNQIVRQGAQDSTLTNFVVEESEAPFSVSLQNVFTTADRIASQMQKTVGTRTINRAPSGFNN